ncbi:MAG: TIGR02757 family protein [Rhodothermales bacterium]
MSYSAGFKTYLDNLVLKYEKPNFILEDPISIPHGFDAPEDQEIIGLFASLLAWGQRKTILNKLEELCERMDFKPARFVYDFDINRDAHHLAGFKHRTFQPEDAVWLTKNLSLVLRQHKSIEHAFDYFQSTGTNGLESGIQGLSDLLFSIDAGTPARLRKHLARPASGSACKRFCMYLRWMVRPGPVDLGIWTAVKPDQLVLPLDVHAGRQARVLGMLDRTQNDWRAALELTNNCVKICPEDPARYDYAFFGSGAYGEALDPLFTINLDKA